MTRKEAIEFILRNIAVLLFLFCEQWILNLSSPPQQAPNQYVLLTSSYIWILVHNKVLFEKLFLNKKYLIYSILFLLGFAIISYFNLYYYAQFYKSEGFNRRGITYTIVWNLNYTLFGTFIFMTYKYILEKRALYQVNILKKEVEIQQLKMQLNPHFLFNSLNNIYSYNLENSTYGNDLILKLGQLMRFIIESSRKNLISLEEEVDFIENYISFEKERLGTRCDIRFERKLGDSGIQVPPLILFPFVENAFKHGTNTVNKTAIRISLASRLSSLSLHVSNSIHDSGLASTRTGLTNIKRRLELLYPNKHELRIDEDSKTYSVALIIETNES